MLAEMLKGIEALVQKANAVPTFIRANEEPQQVYFERKVDGTLVKCTAAPKDRAYSVNRLKDFMAAMDWLPHDKRAVFVGEKGVRGLLAENGDRRERVRFPLTLTDAYEALEEIGDAAAMSHEEFLDFLRITMAGCVPAATVTLFRNLKFKHANDATSDYQAGRESVSRSVLNEMVAGEGLTVPESITASVTVFDEPLGMVKPWPVELALVIELYKGKFKVIPLAGHLHRAMVMTQEAIAEQIAGKLDGALVVCGEVEC